MIINEITKEMFEEYKNIQPIGKYKMLSPQARQMPSLNKRQWYVIIRNYYELERKYSC